MHFTFCLLLILATCLLLTQPCLSFGQTEEKEKSPWVALGLSFLIPGSGQLYNDEPRKGILMFAGGLVGLLMSRQAFEDNGEYCTATFNSVTYTREDVTACNEWLVRQIESHVGEVLVLPTIGGESRMSGSRTVDGRLIATWSSSSTTNHDYDDDDGQGTTGAWIYVGVWAWSMIDAMRTANRINAEAQSQSALEIVPVVIPGRAGARVVMRF